MGDLAVNSKLQRETRTRFIQHLLHDVRALEKMLDDGMIEDDVTRIGAEQEFCLVTEHWRPSRMAEDILLDLDDPHFTTELALFNLEINLDPVLLNRDCFRATEQQLRQLLNKANEAAIRRNNKVLLAGILPTISKNELELDYMTPRPRYFALNDMIRALRGSDIQLRLRGVDELTITHESVLFEACNTSFQMHLQVSPEDFVASYNWAQAISAPILGVSTNSPLLLGRELWRETRIGLFQQSIDTRSSSYALKNQQSRVTYGDGWAYGNAADIFKNDIARHKVILSKDIEKDSLRELEEGRIPQLDALKLHNGTIYRWNRPCYGVGNGKPHLRIENRYIPSGPSVADEMATFAFWVGVMVGRPAQCNDMSNCMDFRDAKENFFKAARGGKASMLIWGDRDMSVTEVVTRELIPIAETGLQKVGIDQADIERYLHIIERRAHKNTGAHWQVKNYRQLRAGMKQDDALRVLTRKIHENQMSNQPVHTWPMLETEPFDKSEASLLAHVMSTQLFTISEHDLAELATSMMEWKGIHHLPVENEQGNLCGLLTWTHMKKFLKEDRGTGMIVGDIMTKQLITATPETSIPDAIALMKEFSIGCLPVIQKDHLVGIVTIKDLIQFEHGQGSQQSA